MVRGKGQRRGRGCKDEGERRNGERGEPIFKTLPSNHRDNGECPGLCVICYSPVNKLLITTSDTDTNTRGKWTS